VFAMWRWILAAMVVGLSLPGQGDWGGRVGFQMDWRAGQPLDLTGSVSLSYHHDWFSLGGGWSLPFTAPTTWSAYTRGSLNLDPLRLNTYLRFSQAGLDSVHNWANLYLRVDEFLGGWLQLRSGVHLRVIAPLQTPSYSSYGDASLRYNLEVWWCEFRISFDLYPSPPTFGAKNLDTGLELDHWLFTVRNRFEDAWERTSLEARYDDGTFSLYAQAGFSPQGFTGLTGELGWRCEWREDSQVLVALELEVRGGFTPQGPTSPRLWLGLGLGDWDLDLDLQFEFPFHLSRAELEATYSF